VRPKIDIPNVEYRLAQMDQQGIDVQAVSLHVGQYHHWADYDPASSIVAIQNEKIAELCAAHPNRFVGLGAVALQHPELTVKQMRHAVKNLDMRGFMITGSVNGLELSDPKFQPFWKAAEELGTVIFLHPQNFPAGQSRLGGNGRLDNVIGNPLETTIALSHLIFEGTLDRYPGVKICAAHGGGYLPSYAGRSDHCVEFAAKFCKAVGKLPSEYLKQQLYFDSLVYTTDILDHLISQVGADRIVLGTDFPFEMGNTAAVDHLLSVTGLTDEAYQAMRDDIELNGPKFGCGLGQCGACSVLIERRVARSCNTPVSAVSNLQITTLEGLGELPDIALQRNTRYPCGNCYAA